MAYNKTPFKMMGKSPMMKALVGKQGNLPTHLQEKILAAPESPAKMYKKSPVKQMKQDSSGVKDVMTGAPAKMYKKSPVKQKAGYVKHKTLTVKGKPLEYNPKFDPNKLITDQSEARDKASMKKNKNKKSPVKQVKVKDLPEKAVEAGENIVKGVKKLGKKIGNITLVSKEKQDCKKKGGRFKKGKCYMPESPAKKKGCSKKY